MSMGSFHSTPLNAVKVNRVLPVVEVEVEEVVTAFLPGGHLLVILGRVTLEATAFCWGPRQQKALQWGNTSPNALSWMLVSTSQKHSNPWGLLNFLNSSPALCSCWIRLDGIADVKVVISRNLFNNASALHHRVFMCSPSLNISLNRCVSSQKYSRLAVPVVAAGVWRKLAKLSSCCEGLDSSSAVSCLASSSVGNGSCCLNVLSLRSLVDVSSTGSDGHKSSL